MNSHGEEKCVEVLDPHSWHISCTSFDEWNPSKILTSSYDGTVRRGDLMKLVFEEVRTAALIITYLFQII